MILSLSVIGWLFHEVKAGSLPFSCFTNAWSHGVSFEPNTMASSSSFPAPRSRSRKPLGKMAGEWESAPNSALFSVSVVLNLPLGTVGGLCSPNTGERRREAEDGLVLLP